MRRVMKSFQSYAAASRVRRMALQMASQHLPSEELGPLRHVFLGLDLGNEGVIHVRDLRTASRGGSTGTWRRRRASRAPRPSL